MLRVLLRRASVAVLMAAPACASTPPSAPEPKEPDDAIRGYPVTIRARMPSEALAILDAQYLLDGSPVRGQSPRLPAGKHVFKATVIVSEVGQAGPARLSAQTMFTLAEPASPQLTVEVYERSAGGALEERVAIKVLVNHDAPPLPDPDIPDPKNARKVAPIDKRPGFCHPRPPVEMLHVGTRAATVVHVCVDAQGLVESVAMLKYSSYKRWDAAALEASRRCRYDVKEPGIAPFCYVLRMEVAVKP